MFMIVMTLLIALKHPVLGYCICLDSYSTTACCPIEEAKILACCDDANHSDESPLHHDEIPCDDCFQSFNVDVGDFFWNSTNDVPDAEMSDLAASSFTNSSRESYPLTVFSIGLPARGDPPPGVNESSTASPLYLKHSVLRL